MGISSLNTSSSGSGKYKGSYTYSGTGTQTALSINGVGRLKFLETGNSGNTMTVVIDGVTIVPAMSTTAAGYLSGLGTYYSGVGMFDVAFENSCVVTLNGGSINYQYELV